MKKIYFVGICILFCTIQTQAMPVQAPLPTTETAPVQKRTFMERMADKILKKRLKKIQKQANMKTNRLATASLIFGILSALSLLAAFNISSLGAVIIALLFTPLSGVIAIILGAVALNRMRIDPSQDERKTLAIIGLALGAICAAAILIMIATGYLVS